MPSWRLSANGPGALTGPALLPAPSYTAMSFQSRGPVNGYPGTLKIPVPRPDAVPQDKTGQALMGISRSADAPDFFLPGLYWIDGPQEHAPLSVFSDNQMPVPAVNPVGQPAVVMPGPMMMGQTQIRHPAVAPKYVSR